MTGARLIDGNLIGGGAIFEEPIRELALMFRVAPFVKPISVRFGLGPISGSNVRGPATDTRL
jgi:hypothetical protein